MNDKVARIAFLLVALGLAAVLVRTLVTHRDPADAASTGSAESTTSTDDNWTPPAGEPLSDDASTATSQPAATSGDAPDPLPHRDVGPALADGEVVDLDLHFVPGTVSHYRITNAIMQRNRETQMAVAQQWFSEVTTRVESVADDGTARVRLTMDSVRVQFALPDGQIYDFDSRIPDETLLERPDVAYAIKPLLSILGRPIEFTLDQHGGPSDVVGVQGWTDAWEETVELLDPGASRKLTSPFAPDTVRYEWSEVLFPPLLGGQLVVGESRDVDIRRDTLQKAYAQFRGPLRATHDDGDIFRVSMRATPTAIPRQGAARSPTESAIAKTRIIADADAYYAAWRFSRTQGRLIDAEIDARYQLHVSWTVSSGGTTGEGHYAPGFFDVERKTRVELLPAATDDK